MAKIDIPVLVIGAGPTGLMFASELKRRGVDCRIVDKLPTPTDKSKALVVHARTLELMENIGIADRFVSKGLKMHGTSVFADDKRIIHLNFDELASPFPFALAIPQSETEALMNAHLESLGTKVERPVELIGFEQQPDHVIATLKHADGKEEKVTSHYIVGCDGSHSTVRHTLGFAFDGAPYPQTFALADIFVEWNHHDDEVTTFFREDGALVFFPMGNGRFRILAEGLPEPKEGEQPTLELFQQQCDKFVVGGAKITNPVWLAYFKIHRRSVTEYRKDRAFLCGDAGHIHSPVGGQGMNTGMQDAFNLAWKLALVMKGSAPESLLNTYQQERHEVAEALLKGTNIATKVVTLRNPIAQSLRNALGPLLVSTEVVQQRLVNTGAMLNVNYHNSPIVGQYRGTPAKPSIMRSIESQVSSWLDFAHGPAPGDRAPDSTVKENNAGATLFKLMAGTSHNLLLFPSSNSSEPVPAHVGEMVSKVAANYGDAVRIWLVLTSAAQAAGAPSGCSVLVDDEHSLHNKYGAAHECLYLIRPDGVVGFRSQPIEYTPLEQHLSKVLLKAPTAVART